MFMEQLDFLRHVAQLADLIEAKARWRGGPGWTVRHVPPRDPTEAPYAYTVGLTEHDLPELVAFSMPGPEAETILDIVADVLFLIHDAGDPPPVPGDSFEVWPGLRCTLSDYPTPQRLRDACAYVQGYSYEVRALVLNLS